MFAYKEDGSLAHLADDVAPQAKCGREFCVSIKWFLATELKGPAALFIPGADQGISSQGHRAEHGPQWPT